MRNRLNNVAVKAVGKGVFSSKLMLLIILTTLSSEFWASSVNFTAEDLKIEKVQDKPKDIFQKG